MAWLIGLGVLVVIALIVIMLYNRLVATRNQTNNAWKQIDVQLKRRHDLIPNLVEVVKDYMSYEQETLKQVIEARNQAVKAPTPAAAMQAENALSGAMGKLFAVMEAYPDLKANQNFLQLQEELSDIENKLAAARRFFNGATTEYNNAVESFPGNLIARNFGFQREILFDLGTDTRKAMEEPPKIQF